MAAKDPLIVAIGRQVAQLRAVKDGGLTQAELAEAARLDTQTIHLIESARVVVGIPRLRRVAEALGLPVSQLIAAAERLVGGDAATGVVPDSEALLLAWEAVPEERRALALRLLREVARG